jgi:hypothetical protein
VFVGRPEDIPWAKLHNIQQANLSAMLEYIRKEWLRPVGRHHLDLPLLEMRSVQNPFSISNWRRRSHNAVMGGHFRFPSIFGSHPKEFNWKYLANQVSLIFIWYFSVSITIFPMCWSAWSRRNLRDEWRDCHSSWYFRWQPCFWSNSDLLIPLFLYEHMNTMSRFLSFRSELLSLNWDIYWPWGSFFTIWENPSGNH